MSRHLQPSFFIIGERKCGTSSLYRYLLEHPNVLPGNRKEMQFFTNDADYVREHFGDYLRDFPEVHGATPTHLDWPELNTEGVLFEERIEFPRTAGRDYVTGEASADTLCDGDPALLRELLPDLALIALLRDPAQRAFSHHRMYKRFYEEGRELSFEPGNFAADMRREMDTIASGERTPCLTPSIYVHNLAPWTEIWNEQLLIVFSSELDDSETFSSCMDTVVKHLALPPHSYLLKQRYNRAPAETMPEDIHDELYEFFAPHDLALERHLGRPLPWRPT